MKRTAIYLAVALVTFGHSASGQQNCHPGFWDGPLFQTSCSAYRRGITYILESEDGSSLRASGWTFLGTTPGKSWSVPSRPRDDKHPLGPKHRYVFGAWPEFAREQKELAA